MVLELLMILLAGGWGSSRHHWTHSHSMAVSLSKLLLWMPAWLSKEMLRIWLECCSSTNTLMRTMTRSTPRMVRDLV